MDEVKDDFNPHAWAKTPAAKIVGPTFPGQLQIVAFGGGTDSTAVLIGLRDHGLKPDRILFADTGGEQQHTYDYVGLMDTWVKKQWGLSIEKVCRTNRAQEPLTLEAWSLHKKMLPSLAYGFKSCSLKFKVAPQDKAVNRWPSAKVAWKAGQRVIKYIGYEAGEARRIRPPESKDGKYLYQYPLVAWGWYRQHCIDAIKKEGLPLSGKSSCFYCPAMKKIEIVALPVELQRRAIAMEQNALENLKTVKGLGRSFAWGELLAGRCSLDEPFLPGVPCDCYDGTDE
jgi:hypothetical protein